jgi:hypothetical protein
MPRRLTWCSYPWVCVCVLLLGTAGAEEPRAVSLKAKTVRVRPPFPTQRTDLRLAHPVGEGIVVGNGVFAVATNGRRMKIATKPGERPSKAIKRTGTDLKLGGLRLRVWRDDNDAWVYAIAEASEFELDRVAVRVLDTNCDGLLEPGKDGYQLPPHPFVLPLPGALILGRQRLAIESVDGERLKGAVTSLYGSRHQLDGLLAANHARMRAGLPPTVIDPEVSAPCSAHARYLRINKWTPATNPHFEVRGRRGFSEAGHRAAMSSVISWTDHASAVPGHWITFYHRFAFLHPTLPGLGISDGTPSVSIIDGKTTTRWSEETKKGWKDPVLAPADGAIDVPAGFHRGGERPIPVERAESCGIPLTVLFLAPDPGITEFRGELVRLGKHGPEPVRTLLPDRRGSIRRYGLIPERPLRSRSVYRVTYRFRRHGAEETVSATFTVR